MVTGRWASKTRPTPYLKSFKIVALVDRVDIRPLQQYQIVVASCPISNKVRKVNRAPLAKAALGCLQNLKLGQSENRVRTPVWSFTREHDLVGGFNPPEQFESQLG